MPNNPTATVPQLYGLPPMLYQGEVIHPIRIAEAMLRVAERYVEILDKIGGEATADMRGEFLVIEYLRRVTFE